jgi:hypothetical protein
MGGVSGLAVGRLRTCTLPSRLTPLQLPVAVIPYPIADAETWKAQHGLDGELVLLDGEVEEPGQKHHYQA